MDADIAQSDPEAKGVQRRVCAIIVCYQPDPSRLAALVHACLKEAATVVLVNNDTPSSLECVPMSEGAVHRIEVQGNIGLAAAQNLGVRWAASQGFGYLLFFDQDSVPRAHLISTLVTAFDAEEATGKPVAAVGPSLIDGRDGANTPFVRFHLWGVERIHPTMEPGARECDFLISSGMLTTVRRFMAIGPWENELFVDNVDMEWCFRARSRGYRCLGVGLAQLEHLIGERVSRWRLFGRSWSIYRHAPARQYYMMRNRMALYRREYVPLAWKLQDIPRAFIKFVFFGLVYGPRRENLRCLLLGLRDGWKGELGPLVGRNDG